MTELKRITQKEIWIIMKVYSGGRIELLDGYWDEHIARAAAANLLPAGHANFSISLHNITLHGHMVDKA